MHWSDHKMTGMSLAYLANVWKIQVYYHIQWEKLSWLNTTVMIVKQDMLMIWKVYLSSVDLCRVSVVDCGFWSSPPTPKQQKGSIFQPHTWNQMQIVDGCVKSVIEVFFLSNKSHKVAQKYKWRPETRVDANNTGLALACKVVPCCLFPK